MSFLLQPLLWPPMLRGGNTGNHLWLLLVVRFLGVAALVGGVGGDAGSRLLDAARSGDTTRMSEELAAGADVVQYADANGWTPLHHAIAQGHISSGKLLLEAGVDANAKHHGALFILCLARVLGRQPLQTLPISIMPPPIATPSRTPLWAGPAGDMTALHEAVQRDDLEACKLLLMHGAQMHLTDRSGCPPCLSPLLFL